jgi:DivIVA domain-containing protein
VLSPIEIKKHEFAKVFRGCDPEEVRGFLDTIAGDLERLLDQNRSQTAELERLRAETSAFQRVEQN